MAKAKQNEIVQIEAPKLRTVVVEIIGTAPYVQHKFSAKARGMMRESQEGGAAKRTGAKKREGKDFDAYYKGAMHIARDADGTEWYGIPAAGLRAAIIRACSVTGVFMTRAKIAVFVEADGFDYDDGSPMVQIVEGEPFPHECSVRLASGVADVRVRPMWSPGWRALVRLRYDEEFITMDSVINLLARAGVQVGIGEGRPDSKKSSGLGWGLFDIGTINEITDGPAPE